MTLMWIKKFKSKLKFQIAYVCYQTCTCIRCHINKTKSSKQTLQLDYHCIKSCSSHEKYVP